MKKKIDAIKTVFIREYGRINPGTGIPQSGTFNDLKCRLQNFKEKYIDALILLPVHPLGTPLWGSVGSPYEPMDYFSIEPSLVKPGWGAGSETLIEDLKKFKKDGCNDELNSFKIFKESGRASEYAAYNALKSASNKDQNLLEQTFYEQFIALQNFTQTVEEAHSIGLKIIMDIPAYFGTGSIAEHLFDRYILKNPDGSYYQPGMKQWGKGWYTLRQLDTRNRWALNYLCSIYKYWEAACKIDGFRIDAILTQPDIYIKKIRATMPNSFLVGETIGEHEEDVEKKYLEEIKLDAIYNAEWIWTSDLENCLLSAHKRTPEKRMFHMRDTHDEGRLKKKDSFTNPKQRYLGLMAAAILGFPGQDIIGFLDGNFSLMEGSPNLHEIYLQDFFKKNLITVILSNGEPVSATDYLKKLLMLRKNLSAIKRHNNIAFVPQRENDVSAFIRSEQTESLLILSNLGKNKSKAYLDSSANTKIDLITDKPVKLEYSHKYKEKYISLSQGQACVFALKGQMNEDKRRNTIRQRS